MPHCDHAMTLPEGQMMAETAYIFSEHGPLSQAFSHYCERDGQIQMAKAVAQALENRHHLLVEAGTGIGKTLAYLVPALCSGGRILISTGTKTLQDQLVLRDLPQVLRALSLPVTVALLKGRANYICHYHLNQSLHDGNTTHQPWYQDLQKIFYFSQATQRGDRADCFDVAENSPAWSHAVSTRDNCLGHQCPHAEACFLLRARKSALEADVLVVNHHLFFADMAIREDGGQELLPMSHVVIFDEAHQIKDIACDFFSNSVSSNQLRELSRDAHREMMVMCSDMPELLKWADMLEYRCSDLQPILGKLPKKVIADHVIAQPHILAALNEVVHSLEVLKDALLKVAERSAGLQRILDRTINLQLQLQLWINPPLLPHQFDHHTLDSSIDEGGSESEAISHTPYVHWLEHRHRSFRIVRTPLSIEASMRRQYLAVPRSWIFCSATLSLAGNFSLIRRDLGLEPLETAQENFACDEAAFDSPFDYVRQARLYIPKHLPLPHDHNFLPTVRDELLPIIQACHGGVFLLCTSHRAVSWFATELATALTNRLILAQKQMSRHQLLDAFRRQGNAVLIGSHSFWEGVDFPGNTLSLVIIDKLPFMPPTDPLQNAIGESLKRQGGDPFYDIQIPQTAIMLKQGVGRLIRSESDHGVLVICDIRLDQKSYGKKLLRALPPMPRVDNRETVCQFLQIIHENTLNDSKKE